MEEWLIALTVGMVVNFITLLYQNWFSRRKDDRWLLLQAFGTLTKLKLHLGEYYPPVSQEIDELSRELLLFAGGVYTRGNRSLAYELVKFARKADKREDKLVKLLQDVSKLVSKPIDKFHKKQNELFAKAAEELKQITEKKDKAKEEEKK